MRQRLGIVILAAAATAGGCVVNQDDRPALTGPSGLAQSISVAVHPDTLLRGQQSRVVIEARDESGQPLPKLHLFLATDSSCGKLSLGEVTTGDNGQAEEVNFTDLSACDFDYRVTITATPVGTNFQTQPPIGYWGASIWVWSKLR